MYRYIYVCMLSIIRYYAQKTSIVNYIRYNIVSFLTMALIIYIKFLYINVIRKGLHSFVPDFYLNSKTRMVHYYTYVTRIYTSYPICEWSFHLIDREIFIPLMLCFVCSSGKCQGKYQVYNWKILKSSRPTMTLRE